MASKWEAIGTERPAIGLELYSAALSTALETQKAFSIEEIVSFKITRFRPTSFIESNGHYYRPIGSGRAPSTCECPSSPLPATPADELEATPPKRRGDARHTVSGLCVTPCDCPNVRGMGLAYHIDPSEYPQIPDNRADLYKLLEQQDTEKRFARGKSQRLAASFDLEDGKKNDVWLNEVGQTCCFHGISFATLRNKRGKHHPKDCTCTGQLLGRNGGVLSEKGFNRLCIKNGMAATIQPRKIALSNSNLLQRTVEHLTQAPTPATPPTSETSSDDAGNE